VPCLATVGHPSPAPKPVGGLVGALPRWLVATGNLFVALASGGDDGRRGPDAGSCEPALRSASSMPAKRMARISA